MLDYKLKPSRRWMEHEIKTKKKKVHYMTDGVILILDSGERKQGARVLLGTNKLLCTYTAVLRTSDSKF